MPFPPFLRGGRRAAQLLAERTKECEDLRAELGALKKARDQQVGWGGGGPTGAKSLRCLPIACVICRRPAFNPPPPRAAPTDG